MRRHERSVTIISEAPKFLLLLDIYFSLLFLSSQGAGGYEFRSERFWILDFLSVFYLGADI